MKSFEMNNKKNLNRLLYIGTIVLFADIIAIICFKFFDITFAHRMIIAVKIAFWLGLSCLTISMVGSAVIFFKQGFKNIRKSEDEPFASIDYHKNNWHDCERFYIKLIQIINYTYRDEGDVDKLVKNKELLKLFARMDLLTNQIQLYDSFIMYACSLGLSIIASLTLRITSNESVVIMMIEPVIIGVAFAAILMMRYYERGHGGSYLYLINEYEKNCLLKKINMLEKDLVIDGHDKGLLDSKQVVISQLILLKKKTKFWKRRAVIDDIERIEELDLCINGRDGCVKHIPIDNGKSTCCMVYNHDNGGKENYGPINLFNDEYYELFRVLDRNGML